MYDNICYVDLIITALSCAAYVVLASYQVKCAIFDRITVLCGISLHDTSCVFENHFENHPGANNAPQRNIRGLTTYRDCSLSNPPMR
jgi:hypothetical protein